MLWIYKIKIIVSILSVVDIDGNIVAGTSTDDMTNMRFGRVGDVPIIGSGRYVPGGSK